MGLSLRALRGAAAVAAFALLSVSCATAPLPLPPDEPKAAAELPAEEEPVTRAMRVDASSLNVREHPDTTASVLATLRRSARVGAGSSSGGWTRVRLDDGRFGWAASRYLKEVRGCLPDREAEIVDPPPLAFAENGPRGVVTVELTVSATGTVTSARVVSNTTGSSALAELAVDEIRRAKFSPLVRDCIARSFIYTYRRDF
jgi:TonB family protein